MKDEPKFYYKKVLKGNILTTIPYPFEKGEKEEYERICNITNGWGGCPCDVDWAKETKVYKEAKNKGSNKLRYE